MEVSETTMERRLLDFADAYAVDGGFFPAAFEGVVEVGGVELGFEEEGVVAFVGVDGDHHAGGAGFFEHGSEFRLFFRVEAKVGINTEDEEMMTGLGGPLEEVGVGGDTGVFERVKV